ncbi:DUF3572 domain-containing protein [Pontivivens nitratireducens]|jgi:hypothetical protein|uniref:DUF3572 domain-containing protein n=1 Tax=Pontivivens nitratireducens TaxID=2758038 RepID=A0A6G7VL96_9RHOB|nr:DUF3572 domain-containing protein [Pontibrevibacter nitratireducens]QIK40809.1 DUF3572 domain-containing protein [Pontibrevibacter nitratireducens]
MNKTSAEALAAQVLGWLAGDDERLMSFLGMTGAEVGDLRHRANDPQFLGFLIDFLLQDEQALIEFCDRTNTPYDAPQRARLLLPGGDLPNWT